MFLLEGADVLVPMQPAEFGTEEQFQRLLEQFPDLLVGDQIDPKSPRRWVLVSREQAISTGAPGASSWAIDHVFLDQDGVPTLVEVKRQSDSRVRREVVGQMLDYAANCSSYWSVESLQSALDKTCNQTRNATEAVLRELIKEECSIEDFWQQVKTNLQAGKIRLLFLADVIPLELRRIVEFLNGQMDPAEVLAIELRQFESEGRKAIVPTVYGQTQQIAAKRSAEGRRWDAASFFDKLEATVGPKELEIANQIFEWWWRNGERQLIFGTGKDYGSVYPDLNASGTKINPVYLSTDGGLWLQFGVLQNKPVFGPVEARRALMQKINSINGVQFTDADLDKSRKLPLKTIAADPEGPSKIIAALKWIDDQLE